MSGVVFGGELLSSLVPRPILAQWLRQVPDLRTTRQFVAAGVSSGPGQPQAVVERDTIGLRQLHGMLEAEFQLLCATTGQHTEFPVYDVFIKSMSSLVSADSSPAVPRTGSRTVILPSEALGPHAAVLPKRKKSDEASGRFLLFSGKHSTEADLAISLGLTLQGEHRPPAAKVGMMVS
jgi:hypothetical protein